MEFNEQKSAKVQELKELKILEKNAFDMLEQ